MPPYKQDSEYLVSDNSSVEDLPELKIVGSICNLTENQPQQSTANIVQEYQFPQPPKKVQKNSSVQPQPPPRNQQPVREQQQLPSLVHSSSNSNKHLLITDSNEMNENVPNEETAEVTVKAVLPVTTISTSTLACTSVPSSTPTSTPTTVPLQIAHQQQQSSSQFTPITVAVIATVANYSTQQQIQTSPQSQKYHQQQHNLKHQLHAYNRYDQQQQPQQHHNLQYHHQHNQNYQYEQRRSQQNYINNQSRRKYDYSNLSYVPNNNTDSAIQTTKTMSWTNSSKKSTASVAVTAIPNNNSNNQTRAFAHSTKTFTNQQHHYQQQSHYHQQQHGGQFNQISPMRKYSGMKVPSSPVGNNDPIQLGKINNSNTTERRNSQNEPLKYKYANTSNDTYRHYNNQCSNNNYNSTNNNNVSNPGVTTTTSTTSTTPHHFSQQQQQPQHQMSTQITHDQQQTLVIDSKQYPGFTTSKKPTVTTSASVATTLPTIASSPIMNLAPPITSNTTTKASSTQSWASLFNDTNTINKSTNASATTSASGHISSSSCNNDAKINLNINNEKSNSSPEHPLPFSSKKPVAKVAPYECFVPAPVNPAVVLSGGMSYSAASAQGILPQTTSAAKTQIKSELPIPTARANLDEYTLKFADFLNKAKPDLSTVSLRPRGLTNPSNYCYINSILQALLGCAPFYNLIRSIPKQAVALSELRTPTVNALISFVSQFSTLPAGLRLRTNKSSKGKDDLGSELQCDSAFEPSEVYRLWVDSREEYVEGRQEDAEEFLSYVLNKLNDEMLEVIKLVAKPHTEQNGRCEVSDNEDGDEWQMICNNRNKGSVTRQMDFGRTPLSDIFRGALRSRLQREGEHSTDDIQPFFTLQLNIEKAASVKDALEILVGRDQLEGVTGSKTKQEVVAWQQMTLEKLPMILILHLKWFDYRSDGCTKILKKVEFPIDLKIDSKILASKKYSTKQRTYRLFAVVYHDGKEATKGHYITDVYHTGCSSWLRYNDSAVKPVSENEVLNPKTPRVPYLLYYRRCDTIPQNCTSSVMPTSKGK